jgi:hypothetical protein
LSKKGSVSWEVVMLIVALIMLATGILVVWFLSGGAQTTLEQLFAIISFQWMFQ